MPTASTIAFNLRVPLCEAALRRRIPLVAHRTEFADAGALLAYSSSQDEQLRRGAQIVDKILRGAKPGEIPIEQPTLFELVVNMRTARTLGLRIPSEVLLRTTRLVGE
jgi:putative ABC transport system substrate-binding protein